MNNIDYYYPDGALGLGLLDNFYSDHLKKKNIEFFEDFDDGNKPANDFAIYLDEVIILKRLKNLITYFLDLMILKLWLMKFIIGFMYQKINYLKIFGF